MILWVCGKLYGGPLEDSYRGSLDIDTLERLRLDASGVVSWAASFVLGCDTTLALLRTTVWESVTIPFVSFCPQSWVLGP